MSMATQKVSARELAVLSYWRASQRVIQGNPRLRLSEARANIVLINQAIDLSWPRLKTAAVVTLLIARRKKGAGKRAALPSEGKRR